MSETLPRSASAPNRINVATPTNEELHIMVNGEAPASPSPEETQDNREVSHSANLLHRVADFLQQRKIDKARSPRALNRAHGDALKEYRNNYNEDYTDHISNLAESDVESQQVFGQRLLDREHSRADRQEFTDNATAMARSTGEAALSGLQATGEITIGLGLLAGEAVYRGAETATKAVIEKTTEVAGTVRETIDMGKRGIYDTTEAIKDAYRDTTGNIKEAYDDTKAEIKDKLKSLADAARARRTARREKWDTRKKAALEFITSAKDKGSEVIQKVKSSGEDLLSDAREKGQQAVGETLGRANAARAAGSAALNAYRNYTEQNKL